MIYFKKNISYLRNEKSMTLKEISANAGFSTSQWNNYELGFSFPKFLDLIKISKYFDVSESDLIHVDLQIKKITEEIITKEENNIITLQNKLIKIQEEKINNLQIELINCKKNNH